jgi:lactate permease
MPPAVPAPVSEPALFNFNWLSATGTGIFVAALIAGFAMRLSPRILLKVFVETLVSMRFTFVTIAALMGDGGHAICMDATVNRPPAIIPSLAR